MSAKTGPPEISYLAVPLSSTQLQRFRNIAARLHRNPQQYARSLLMAAVESIEEEKRNPKEQARIDAKSA
jgi:hypothetical protein